MNKKILFSGAGIAFLLSVIGVSAASVAMVSYEMISGKVKIHLETYMEEDGKEKPWEEETNVLPGEDLSKIPRVFNDGVDCYVRAQIVLENDTSGPHMLSEENIQDMNPKWIKAGGYYYFTDILKSGKNTDIFRKIHIPSEWEQTEDEERWNLNVITEAVQAEHFTPDFTVENPWLTDEKDIKIERAGKDPVPEESYDKDEAVLEIHKDLEGVGLEDGKMFKSLDTLLPGDRRTGSITLRNKEQTEQTVNCRIEADEGNEFLKKLQIAILETTDGKSRSIYEGALIPEKLKEISFSEVIKGEKNSRIDFAVMLPEDAGNEYAAKKGAVRFYFTTARIPSKAPEKKAEPPRTVEKVQTDDTSGKIPAAGFAISAMLMTAAGFLYVDGRRRSEKDET